MCELKLKSLMGIVYKDGAKYRETTWNNLFKWYMRNGVSRMFSMNQTQERKRTGNAFKEEDKLS